VTLDALLAGIGAVLLFVGLGLATIGLYGLILKPDLFDQLHVAGLVTGPGVIVVLLAAVGSGSPEILTSSILVVAFVLVTGSLSTHVIASAGIRRYPSAAPAPLAGPGRDAPLAADPAGVRGRPSMGMRVVVGYDGSASAEVAVRLAASLDWPAGTVIRLVEAIAGEGPPSIDGSPTDPVIAAAGRDDAHEAALRQAAQSIERPGIRVETVARSGDAADVIVGEVDTLGADLLVTGSRRRNVVQSLLGWSAAGEIVDRSPCPVLVARTASLRSVMLTTDGSPQSLAAAELLASWPIFDLTPINVVTVSGDGPPARREGAPDATTNGQRAVDLTAAQLMDAGREVVTEVLRGRPADRLVETARVRGDDLIVIGSRGRTGLGRTLLGSVAGEVLAAASCSVLIVAPPPRRFASTTTLPGSLAGPSPGD
jgi:multicomponent Na+:H+ antiporter subunit G